MANSPLTLAPLAVAGEEADEATYSLTWEGIDSAQGDAAEIVEGTAQVGLVIANLSDAVVEVELRVTGDAGSTLDYEVLSQVIELKAASKETVGVELSGMLAKSDFEYSGHLRASAVVHGANDQIERIVSPSAFYHPTGDGGVALYNEQALQLLHAKGDLLGQEGVVDGMDAIEPGYAYRVMRWVDPKIEDQAMAELHEATLSLLPGESPIAAPTEVAAPDAEDQATYTLCVRWEIETRDSHAETWTGQWEDYWQNANDPSIVHAFGVRVRVGMLTYDTNPSTGCVTFQQTAGPKNVTVYELAKNSYDSFARIHTGGRYDGSEGPEDYYPGMTYSWYVSQVQLTPNGTTYVAVGDHIPRTTGMAAIGYTLNSYAYGVSHAAYHVALHPAASVGQHYATVWPANGDYDSAFLSFEDPAVPNSTSDIDLKFTVAHEYGHAFGTFFGPEQMFSTNYGYDPGDPGDSNCIAGNPTHSMMSMEWSLDAAYEGWAEFVSAMVWNFSPTTTGSYRGQDLESHEAGDYYGGIEENMCLPCQTCEYQGHGSGVELDWMRAFWDFYTDDRTLCGNPPSSTDVARFFGNLLSQPGIDHPEGWPGSVAAVDELAADGHVGACFATRWYSFGYLGIGSISHWNGLRQTWPP